MIIPLDFDDADLIRTVIQLTCLCFIGSLPFCVGAIFSANS